MTGYEIRWTPHYLPAPTRGQSWCIDPWRVATIVPCLACGGRLLWAEAGYVPGYRICEGCGRPWLAEPCGNGQSGWLRVRVPDTGHGRPAWDCREAQPADDTTYDWYAETVRRFGGTPSERATWEALQAVTWEPAPDPADAPADSDCDDYSLPRSGKGPLKFRGVELDGEDGERDSNGRDYPRWHDLAVYRTASGKFVLHIAYRTRYQGETDHDEVTVCETPTDVAIDLETYNPCDCVQGYPAGEAYAERQDRLLQSINLRYRAQVCDLLMRLGPDFAEEVE